MCGKIKVSECQKQTIARILSFLFIFFSLGGLFLLGVNLNTRQEKSLRERRMLEPFPHHFIVNAKNFEKYISDHIPLRDKLIDFYFESKLGIDFGTHLYLIAKNNFIFRAKNHYSYYLNPLKIYQNEITFSQKHIETFQQNFKKIADFASKNNIKVYLLIPPSPMRVYHWLMPDYILRKNAPSVTEQVERAISNFVTVLPVESVLTKKAKTAQYPLFYKTDSHWSEDGAYEAYKCLMANIQSDFEDVVPLKDEDFNMTETQDVLYTEFDSKRGDSYLEGVDYGNVSYRHYTFKNENDIQTKWQKRELVSSTYEKGLKHRVYLIGDSFSYHLLHFLKPTFEYVHFHRYNSSASPYGIYWPQREKDMLADKTDILILAPSDMRLTEFLRHF